MAPHKDISGENLGGFSLVELLVALALVAGVLVPMARSAAASRRTALAIAERNAASVKEASMRTIEDAEKAFR